MARSYTGRRPPFCPNSDCPHHTDPKNWRWRSHGTFHRPSDGRRFPRFRCFRCGRTFSTRTFSSTYWLRRRNLLFRIAELNVNGACLRQIGRIVDVSHSTVNRHLARVARQAILAHTEWMSDAPIDEPVAFDGFETFEYSQFFPNHFHLAVGQNSWFTYHFTDSPLRRKGRMTNAQRKKRAALEGSIGRPDPKAIENDVAHLLEVVAEQIPGDQTIRLLSDEHPAYPRAIRRALRDRTVTHETTPSTDPRTRANALFSVNLADLLIRHSAADHRRETIAFAKRRQCAAERLVVHMFWRNYIKPRRENGGPETAAMAAGVARAPTTFAQSLRRRRFVSRTRLPTRWRRYYFRKIRTAALARQSEHLLTYAT